MALRHNHILNATANLFTEVCKNICVKPQPQALIGETFSEETANKSNQGRVDINARGFCLTGQVAFFDVKVFNPTAKWYVHQELCKSYKVNKKDKNRQCNERILQVDHGTFAPLVVFAAWWRVESFMPVFQRWYPKNEHKIMRLLHCG